MAKSIYLEHIDGLRGLAVVLIIMMHLEISIVSGGFIGVDIFFVISGFLITRLIINEIEETGSFSFLNFYLRRSRRIIPPLLVTLILCFVFGTLLLSPEHFKHLGGSIAASALSFSNVFYWQESGYFDVLSQFKPLLNTWSLGVEEQFYIVWPMCIVLFSKCFSTKNMPVIFITMFIVSLGINIQCHELHANALYYLMPFRAFELCIGGLMVWVIQFPCKYLIICEILCATGIALMLYPAIKYTNTTIFPSYNALVPCIGSALVIYSGEATNVGMILKNPASKCIGLISYSLYLVHWPMITFFRYYIDNKLSIMDKPIVLLASCLLSTAMYIYIEQPFRKTESQVKPILQLAVYVSAISIVSMLGFSMYFSNGWMWRLPKNIQPFVPKMTSQMNFHKAIFGGNGFPFPRGWTHKTKESKANIVILGDSFAQSLQYGITKELAKPYKKSVYTIRIQCIPLPNLTQYVVTESRCDTKAYQHALFMLKDAPDSVLILFLYWIFRIPKTKNTFTNQKMKKDITNDYSDYSVLTNALENLRKLLGKRQLLIIGCVPSPGTPDTISCLSRPYLGRTKCQYHLTADYYVNMKKIFVNKVLEQYTTRMNQTKNTYFLNPYDTFCSNKTCYALDSNGFPFYSDISHLSTVGSAFFIASTRNKILEIMHNDTSVIQK